MTLTVILSFFTSGSFGSIVVEISGNLGHSCSDFRRKIGLLLHKLYLRSASAVKPCEAESAGFSLVLMYLH